jgi:hypothetical protein
MLRLVGLLAFIFFGTAHATTVVGQIVAIDQARSPEEMTHLYMEDGSIVRLRPEENHDLDAYAHFVKTQTTLKLTLNTDRQVIRAVAVAVKPSTIDSMLELPRLKENHLEATILSTEADAINVFKSLRKKAWNASQCYNRAHVWAYETHKKSGINLKKVFLFFTRKYIREFNFDWWFHVAPYAHVMNEAVENERVLDETFLSKPVSMKTWTDLFMKNKVVCPVVEKYSEYAKNQEAAFCYLYKTSSYDYQPRDLDNFEKTGVPKTDWVRRELKKAFHDAFGIFI